MRQRCEQSGTFGASSLNAASLIYVTGLTGTGTGSQVDAGVFTPNGAGAFSFAGDKNSGGSVSTNTFSGSYSVAASGRALISKTGSNTPAIIEYLTSANTGFVASTDVQVSSNFAQPILVGHSPTLAWTVRSRLPLLIRWRIRTSLRKGLSLLVAVARQRVRKTATIPPI